ncbi:MAG: SDR family NAD(P)-dependent oxidoreductase [Synechococcales cyanobacterium]
MISLHGQTALITGASSGIGAACARALAQQGSRLILAARRLERLEQLAHELTSTYGIPIHCLALDVRDPEQVQTCLGSLPEPWQAIDMLINNAGLSRGWDPLQEGHLDDWEEMIDTNLKGLLYVTRAIAPGMLHRQRGHIVNLGSVAGHYTYPRGNVYCATKAAVRALTEGMKMDFLGTPIRVSSVDPGLVETEFSTVRFHGDAQQAARVYQNLQPLTATDIAEVIVFCLTRPAHVNINQILLMPVDQASPTQVYRHTAAGSSS